MNPKNVILSLCLFFLCSNFCLGQNASNNKNEKKILSFQEGPQNVVIDEANKKIVFSVPPFIDLTKIKPTIKVSERATVSPASDTEQDFTKPFIYTVKSADGSTATYTVIATKKEGMGMGELPPNGSLPNQGIQPMGGVKTTISLNFDPTKFTVQTQEFQGKVLIVRAFERIVYVTNPADITQEVMNIYVPEAYFNGGTIDEYSAATAPIFFPNKVGGYMPSQPANFINTSQTERGGGGTPINAVMMALSKGFVVASAGTRGRISPIGKAPAGIVDLKAAVRYLKLNDKLMPGDANKIISNGTSAGGAMSTLLGATGNHPGYEPYLKEIGAANTTDDIFAVSAYCPIINLENADMAYEWQFNQIHTFKGRGGAGILNDASIKVSNELKKAFPLYFNSLNLKNNRGENLTLDEKGEGNLKDFIKTYLINSAQKALDSGIDLSNHSFLKIDTNVPNRPKVLSLDFEAYLVYIERMKTPPAFDALDIKSFENNLFGTKTIENQHFTAFSMQNSTATNPTMADKNQIKMMNPMNYIGNKFAKTSKYWRVRHGAKDRDTGFAIPLILATTLQNKGFKIDFALPWDKPHSGDYDLEELFDWMKEVCKK